MDTDRRKPVFIRTTISQNLRTPRKFFLVVLVLVLVLDWVSGLDYEDDDDDEDDSAAAAPLRVNPRLSVVKKIFAGRDDFGRY